MHPQSSDARLMAILTPATKHYPAGLRFVRALFLRAEYRKCIQTCIDLLQTPDVRSHPLQRAFLHFYTALSYDEMGRAMHHNSIAKVPALDSAEQSYLAALHALPSPEDAELLCLSLMQKSRADSFFDVGEQSPSHDGEDFHDEASILSSPAREPSERFSIRSPTESPAVTASDFDDLESHDRFSELLTPSRVLNREYSRMSLLETTPPVKRHSRHMSGPYDQPIQSRMQQNISRMSLLVTPPRKPMSQGLLRPIRPGSAPKQFYIPPRFADTSQLPRAIAGKQTDEALSTCIPRNSTANGHHNLLGVQHKTPDAVSPISRLGTDRCSSEVSTISAISPMTPTRGRNTSLSSDHDANQSLCLRFNDHLDSMRMQLETHMTSVQSVKAQLREYRAERASSRRASTIKTPLQKRTGTADEAAGHSKHMKSSGMHVRPGGLPRLRSYWSFVPVDAKDAEKQRRLRAGKERKWERQTARFDPTKYQDLCERALNEL